MQCSRICCSCGLLYLSQQKDTGDRNRSTQERKTIMSASDNIEMKVTREVWIGNSYTETVDTVTFDATYILGSVDNDSLPAPYDIDDCGDWIFETAIDAGLAESYDGPYTVIATPEYADYYDERQSGAIEPDKDFCKRRLAELTLKNDEKQLEKAKALVVKLEARVSDGKQALGIE